VDKKMDEIQLVTLGRDHVRVMATLVAEAFRDEPINRVVIDMDNPRVRDLYARVSEAMILWHLAGGHLALGAMEGSQLVAVVVVKSPHGDASLIETMRIALPRVWGLLPIMRYVRYRSIFRNLRTLASLGKPPDHVPAPHYTINALAVDPEKQGQGLGRRLMDRAYELASSDPAARGLYLIAGGTRNRTIYERLGYMVLHRQELDGTGVYHMFRAIERS
jgi:GNAT superfamily N-acetyltransferase